MRILDRILEDLKTAQKSNDAERVEVLRFVLAQIRNKEIEKKGIGKESQLSDEEVVDVLRKESKKRKEAIDFFRRGNRDELVNREEKGVEMISIYLPKELSSEEIEKIVSELITQGFIDFNSLMKESMKKLKGRADGKAVSDVIKVKLGQ
jgi:uncharacterized protein